MTSRDQQITGIKFVATTVFVLLPFIIFGVMVLHLLTQRMPDRSACGVIREYLRICVPNYPTGFQSPTIRHLKESL